MRRMPGLRGVGRAAEARSGCCLVWWDLHSWCMRRRWGRNRVPTWRLGRAKSWMRGHLWLGLLALPMILFHGGFHFGGTLTRVLMWLLIITVASGVDGALLQDSIPKKMNS